MGDIIKRIINEEFVLIAEIGVNYYDIAQKNNISPMDAAKLMILEAYKSGVHAVKFQTYKANTLAAKYSPSYWDTKEEKTTSQYELFKKYDSFGVSEYNQLHEYCKVLGIEFLSTAFDYESADYLYDLMNVYKISSSDLSNLPFIEYQAKKGKPILLSVGASNEEEIEAAINTIRKNNNEIIVLLHCVLEYPTPYEHANLNKIISISKRFTNIKIGYSDHTKPDSNFDVLKTAYNLGAKVIEKHFTLDKTLSGNDHYHAMDPNDAKRIIESIQFIDLIRGGYELHSLESETTARLNARRSLVATRRIIKGEVIQEDMLAFKRPGTGIPPFYLKLVVGKKTSCDIEEDQTITYDMIENLKI